MAERFRDFDKKSGPFFLMTVLTAEIGELADAVKNEEKERITEELADVVFAAVSIANIYDIDLSSALGEKYLNRDVSEISAKWAEPYLGKRL
ncbi:MAG: MazG nucleotide pyrophosphohydrolase domain-containing protein, partial [Candidatus Hydrothermarchaeales archaeon]